MRESATPTTLSWTGYISLLLPLLEIPERVVNAVRAATSPIAIELSNEHSWGFEDLEAIGGCEHFRPLVPMLMAAEIPFNLSDEGCRGIPGRHVWWEPGMRFPEVEIRRSW